MEEEIDQKTQLTWHSQMPVELMICAKLIFYWCYFRQDATFSWPSVSSPRKWEHLIIWSLWSFALLKLTSGFAFKRGDLALKAIHLNSSNPRHFISLQLKKLFIGHAPLDRGHRNHTRKRVLQLTPANSWGVCCGQNLTEDTPCEMWGPLASLYCCRLLVWSPLGAPEARIWRSAVCRQGQLEAGNGVKRLNPSKMYVTFTGLPSLAFYSYYSYFLLAYNYFLCCLLFLPFILCYIYLINQVWGFPDGWQLSDKEQVHPGLILQVNVRQKPLCKSN